MLKFLLLVESVLECVALILMGDDKDKRVTGVAEIGIIVPAPRYTLMVGTRG
jgi:hypothetical protein